MFDWLKRLVRRDEQQVIATQELLLSAQDKALCLMKDALDESERRRIAETAAVLASLGGTVSVGRDIIAAVFNRDDLTIEYEQAEDHVVMRLVVPPVEEPEEQV